MSVRASSSSSVTENKLRILQKQKHTHTLFITTQRRSNTSSEEEVDTLQPEAWTRCHKQPHLPLVSDVCSRSGETETQEGYESNKTITETRIHSQNTKAGNTGMWSGVCVLIRSLDGSWSQMVQTFSPNRSVSPPPVSAPQPSNLTIVVRAAVGL